MGCGSAVGCVWVVGGSVTGLRGVMAGMNWASCGAWLQVHMRLVSGPTDATSLPSQVLGRVLS